MLHIVTLVPYSRKVIVNATLSNDRIGIAVILDASNGAGYVEPEVKVVQSMHNSFSSPSSYSRCLVFASIAFGVLSVCYSC